MLLPPRLRKGGSRSVITSLTTITEEDEEQRSRRKKRRRKESDSILQGDEKKPSSRPDCTISGHNTIISSTGDVQNIGRPDLLVLKLDERQRLAKERREENEKRNAREAQLLEREERARLHYEKQLEDRRRRLEEQRIKEERRRAAVEEKRRLKLEEEKARYEAVVRRTQEKSQRPKQNRWSWGGTINSGTSQHSDADRRAVSTMNLSKHIHPVINKRLSSSSATLLSSTDQGSLKRTSLSSSCLITKVPSKARLSREKIHPDRPPGMHRLPLTPWESNIISRLQTPTHSYLARSRSAVCLSVDAASCHQTSLLSVKTMQPRSAERPIRAGLSLERAVKARPEPNQCRRATQSLPVDRKDKDYVRKSWANLSCPTPTLTLASIKRAPSPGSQRTKVNQPSPARSSIKPPQKSPTLKRSSTPPPPSTASLSKGTPSLLPGNLRPIRLTPENLRASPEVDKDLKEEEESKREEAEGCRGEEEEEEEEKEEKQKKEQSEKKGAAEFTRKVESNGVERVTSSPAVRTSVGTTDPEEASRLLTEKRRQAREQREKEEEEKRRQEEAERRHREDMARKIAEEKAKREEEAQRLADEKKCKEEEDRRVEEERQQREREEEAARLQRQKEEEEARQREEAERLRQQRERHFQKEEAERLERKKRLEEIMKRTRRSDQKSPGQTRGTGNFNPQNSQDAVNVAPGIPSITVSAPQTPQDTQHKDSNGHTNPDLSLHTLPSAGHESSTDALQENGIVTETAAFEEVIEVPMVAKLSRQEGDGEEEDEKRRRTPLLAFRENGSTHDLSEWEQNRVQQHAGDV